MPESYGDAGGAANAVFGIGQHAAIGYSPFGVNNAERWGDRRPGTTTPASSELEEMPLARAYALLAQMTPLILEAQAKGTIAAVWLNTQQPKHDIPLGNYMLNVDLQHSRRNPAPTVGYAIVISVGPDEYFIGGHDVQIIFTPNTPGPEIAGLASVETGKFVKGQWIPGRKVNGDDVVLDYDQAGAAAKNQSGSGLIFLRRRPLYPACETLPVSLRILTKNVFNRFCAICLDRPCAVNQYCFCDVASKPNRLFTACTASYAIRLALGRNAGPPNLSRHHCGFARA